MVKDEARNGVAVEYAVTVFVREDDPAPTEDDIQRAIMEHGGTPVAAVEVERL
jgi:hypothetical protein